MSRIVRWILAGVVLFAAPSWALDLTIGRSTETTSMDPHFSILGNDSSTAENIFERLLKH